MSGELKRAYDGSVLKKTREERGLKNSLEAACENLIEVYDDAGNSISVPAHELLAAELVKQAIDPGSRHYKFAVEKMLEYIVPKPKEKKEEGEKDAKKEIESALRKIEQRMLQKGLGDSINTEGIPYRVEDDNG